MTALANIPPISNPMPWQQDLWSIITQKIDQQRLPHALLLSGHAHIGKSRFALALARLLLCSAPEAGSNCGRCHACQLSASGGHGDFLWLMPAEKSRVIKIDQVRELVEFSGMTANFGRRKVAIICPAESMNKNAANALLKVLEEPPPDTFLLLITHAHHLLPATVISRCQQLRFPVPSREASENWLTQLTGQATQTRESLDAATNLPMLAEALIAEEGTAAAYAKTTAVNAFINGQLGSAGLKVLLSDSEPLQILKLVVGGIQAHLRALDSAALSTASARAAFRVMDELYAMQRAIYAGSNPNQPLLIDTLLTKVQGKLGRAGHGDTIELSD
ncbi:MAG: DNA polymerase III subunit delta' [Pseudomonadota bacterium]